MQLDKGGRATKVFDRATSGNGDPFNLPAESGRYQGFMVLQAVQTDGAVPTAITVTLQVSLDGVLFQDFITGTNLQTGPKQLNVGGLGAGAILRLVSTSFTLNGAGPNIFIYAIAG